MRWPNDFDPEIVERKPIVAVQSVTSVDLSSWDASVPQRKQPEPEHRSTFAYISFYVESVHPSDPNPEPTSARRYSEGIGQSESENILHVFFLCIVGFWLEMRCSICCCIWVFLLTVAAGTATGLEAADTTKMLQNMQYTATTTAAPPVRHNIDDEDAADSDPSM